MYSKGLLGRHHVKTSVKTAFLMALIAAAVATMRTCAFTSSVRRTSLKPSSSLIRGHDRASTKIWLRTKNDDHILEEDPRAVAQSLLSSISDRIADQRTKTTTSSSPMQPMVQNMLQSTLKRAYSTTQTVQEASTEDDAAMSPDNPTTTLNTTHTIPHYEFPLATRYKNHPAISNVALAHALWASVLRPNIDTAIDATCGNGGDSLKLAQMLFQDNSPCHSQLLCLDIQKEACDNTQRRLEEYFAETIISPPHLIDNIQVLHASHEMLPRPAKNTTSIGLVVYNLGWLPQFDKECITNMETTLSSIVDAATLVRIGGMISVITYPATGPEEDAAVRLFLECLALLSSNTRTWQETIEAFGGDFNIASNVQQAMERVIQHNPPDQTWRVTQHAKLGMDHAPILITATRIK